MHHLPIQFSKRGALQSLAEEISRCAAEAKQHGKDLVSMNVGAPGTGAPKQALEALQHQMAKDVLGYTTSDGLPLLRERICQMYAEQYQQTVSPDNIIVTYGASAAMLMACLALADVGNKIAVPLPCYSNYLVSFRRLDLNIEYIETDFEHNFCITPEQVMALDSDVRALIIVNPSNPTGSIISPTDYEQIINICLERNITVISDEIYQNIVFDGAKPVETALRHSHDLIIINSFSKYYSMPGWRVGWMVVPDYLSDQMKSVARSLFIAPPTPSQYVAAAAMDCEDELQDHLTVYAKNREILLQQMPQIGFDRFSSTDGAFYFYAHTKHLHCNCIEFCQKMINEAGVIASPGKAFDPISGDHYVRFSYAGTTASIERAVDRLQRWVPTLK